MIEKSLKITFTILIIILMIVAIYINYSNRQGIKKIGKLIKICTPEIIVSDNIRIGLIEFDNMNPILSNNKNVQDISRLIFDPLFTLTEDFKLKEALGLECSKINDITYIIKLRENVIWQDGNKFDASDVIFTINMIKKEENNSAYKYNLNNISNVEEIDEYTLKITTNEKIPYFEYNLIFPIVSSKYFNENNFKEDSKNLMPIGTGMFYISDFGNNTILLKNNNKYWNNKKIKLDSINLNLYNSLSDEINAFKDSKIDIFTTSNNNVEEYLKHTSYNKQEYINRNYDYLILNCENNILANKEVRQAINLAINKEEIIKDIYNGKYIQSNFPLDFGSYIYNRNDLAIYYNYNEAKDLLIDNGWKYNSKNWTKILNYKELNIELSLLVDKNNSNLVKVAKKIKEQLESIGIVINITEVVEAQYNSYINNNEYDIVLVSSNYGYSPVLNKYFKDGNLANLKNEEITNILNEVENITDDSELKNKYLRIAEIYNDEVPYISLYYNTNTLIYSSNLKGSINPNSYNLFYNIETWYREYGKK